MAVQQRNTATKLTDTAPQRPPTPHDMRKQPLSTALPTIRDEEAVGSNPATPTPCSQFRGQITVEVIWPFDRLTVI
jgi:hypothetical protein